jgi:excisionase family DNA binding protein
MSRGNFHKEHELDQHFPIGRLALRPKEAAKALGISERLLWSKTNADEIPHTRIGKAILYPLPELQRWLSEQAVKAVQR